MTAVAHCRSPLTCSVCLGAAPRVVTVADGVVSVDGVEERLVQPALNSPMGTATAARHAARRARRKL